jgi:hypothetical protein
VALGTVYAHSLIDFPLQVFAIQLTVTAWAAIAFGETGGGAESDEPEPVEAAGTVGDSVDEVGRPVVMSGV